MKVRVWNDNTHPYKETFKGDPVYIPPKTFIMMEEDEAYQFKGTYCQIIVDSDGNHQSQGFKMIRIERNSDENVAEVPKAPEFGCMACKYAASSKADLSEHVKTHEHITAPVDEIAETEIKKRRGRPAKAS